MYSTCISCHAPLGANDALERFPVGRRLAFDGAKGRLWVVCPVCRQWNLAPIEERWEAIEDGEKLFRDAKLRVSSENVGLARLADGSELIRIGGAQRPEFAAWRYGARFTARWILTAPGAAVGAAMAALAKVNALNLIWKFGPIPATIILGSRLTSTLVTRMRVASRVTLPDGERVPMTQAHIIRMRVVADDDEPGGWYLKLRRPPPSRSHGWNAGRDPETIVRGAEAVRVAAKLLPKLNRTGGLKDTVAEAVKTLERFPSQDAVFRLAGRYDQSAKSGRFGRYADEVNDQSGYDPDTGDKAGSALSKAPASVRLALEMAAHEEQERRALDGELGALEEQWKEAEEIAGIADNLVLPSGVLRQLERFRLR